MYQIEEYKRKIITILKDLERNFTLTNKAGRFDINKEAEEFYRGLLNLFYGWNLKALNSEKEPNYEGVDLGDPSLGIAVQITSENDSDKIHHSIKGFKNKLLKSGYKKLYILMFRGKQNFPKADFAKSVDSKFNFEKAKHIIDHSDLSAKLRDIEFDQLVSIYDYLIKTVGINKSFTSSLLDVTSLESERIQCQTKLNTEQSNKSENQSNSTKSVRCNELFNKYYNYVKVETSKAQVLGDSHSHQITDVFIEISIIKDRERPSPQTLAEYQKIIDIELQKRRRPLLSSDYNEQIKHSKNLVNLRDLLKEKTRVIIVASPGGGKSTLLRYLTNQTLKQNERLPIFLELKTIKQKDFEAAGGVLSELIFNQTIAKRVCRTEDEKEEMRNEFYNRLKSGLISIFLDGLDEVSGEDFFISLRQELKEFIKNPDYSQSNLVVSARPYAVVDQFDRNEVQELELAPFNSEQIEQFVYLYYGNEQISRSFLDKLHYRNELKELASVPALLGFLLVLFREQNELPESSLGLYNEIVQQLVREWDEEKAVKREYTTTPTRRVDFIKHLAFTRLFKESETNFSRRLIFTRIEILEEAENYCASKGQLNLADRLAEEVTMTPLLRQIGTDTYAFTHLTLLEYLAATELAKHESCEKLFCRSYFDSTLCEMEVLPMTLGITKNQKQLFDALEQLPESIDYKNLRLKVKSLRYGEPPNSVLDDLINRLTEMIYRDGDIEYGYFELIAKSFNGISGTVGKTIAQRIGAVLHNEHEIYRHYGVKVLGFLSNETAIELLKQALDDEDSSIRIEATFEISRTNSSLAFSFLKKELASEDRNVRESVVEGLWQLGSEDAIKVLKKIVNNDEDYFVRRRALQALANLCGKDDAISILIEKLKDLEDLVRRTAIIELGEIGGEEVVDGLIQATADNLSNTEEAIEWLGNIGGQKAYDFLITSIEKDTGQLIGYKAEALGNIGNPEAIPILIKLLDKYNRAALKIKDFRKYFSGGWINKHVATRIAFALYQLGNDSGIPILADTLENGYYERRYAAIALSKIKGIEIIPLLFDILNEIKETRIKHENDFGYSSDFNLAIVIGNILRNLKAEDLTSVTVVMADFLEKRKNYFSTADDQKTGVINLLGRIGGRIAIDALIKALDHADPMVQLAAIIALGKAAASDEKAVEAILIRSIVGVNAVTEQSARILARMDEDVLLKGLFLSLKSEWRVAREVAAKTILYYSDSKEIIDVLSDLTVSDTKESVRLAAQKALLQHKNKQRYF